MTKIVFVLLLITLSVTSLLMAWCGGRVNTAEVDESVLNIDSSTKNSAREDRSDCESLPFHFVITENAQYTPNLRHIEVFLESRAFSKDSLSHLFLFLSKQNPEPTNLTVVVKTDWQQLAFPSDCPPTGTSSLNTELEQTNYYQATFYRRDRERMSSYFRYNPDLKEYKTILLDLQRRVK